ncbi:MAG TPA: tetratricopeptide repeat protein, partial [Vicinamibacterales bacterium]|nr:tetratricopeptide repeat protein [Vicinamibacterales bacterium]
MRASARLALIGFCALWVPSGLVARSQQLPSAETALQQADAMFAEGRYGEAREVYRLALAAEDRQVSSRAATGLVLSLLRVAEFATAYKEAHDLRQAQPDDPVIAALYGDALWASGVFEQAETTFLAALSRDPAHARARHGLARSLAAQNRLTAALVEAQEAVRLDPLTSDFRYTLAYIHERMGRFDTAAEAYTRYV